MEKRIMRIFSVILGCVMVVCVGLLMGISDIHYKSEVLAKDIQKSREYRQSLKDRMRDEMANAEELASFADKGQIRIAIPKGVSESDIKLNEDIMNREYQVVIPNVNDEYFDNNPIMGSVSRIDDFFAYEDDSKGYFDIKLNGIYDCRHTVDGDYLYLDFEEPHKLYDSVVVIDAGHGGKDVGAIQGNYNEKDIDLDIVLKLKELLDNDPSIKAYYTRLSDTNPTLEERVRLSNEVGADVFLSVHNNSLSGFGSATTSGTQVLYYVSDGSGNSKTFADICLNNLCSYLGSDNRGLVNGDDIYIIHNSKSPVALVEIGFLSNQSDLRKLLSEDYQKTCAKALYDSIKEMISKTYKE